MIHLNPINFRPVSFKQKNNNINFGKKIPSISSDVFVKSKASKTEKEESEFLKYAEEYGLADRLSEIITPENVLGKGFSHTVYSIPGCDDYVLRTHTSSGAENIDYSGADIKVSGAENKDLQINIGQIVGVIEIETPEYLGKLRVEVMKKQSGTPVGNPPSEAIYDDQGRLKEGEIAFEATERKERYADSIKILASLPVEAYEGLIKNYKEAAEFGYSFDHLNSNNLLVDAENQSINFIDMDRRKAEPDYGNLLYALTNIYYFDTYANKYDGNMVSDSEVEEAMKNTTTIISKYIEAMQKQQVKFDLENMSMEFFKFMQSFPFAYVCRAFEMEKQKQFLIEKGVA